MTHAISWSSSESACQVHIQSSPSRKSYLGFLKCGIACKGILFLSIRNIYNNRNPCLLLQSKMRQNLEVKAKIQKGMLHDCQAPQHLLPRSLHIWSPNQSLNIQCGECFCNFAAATTQPTRLNQNPSTQTPSQPSQRLIPFLSCTVHWANTTTFLFDFIQIIADRQSTQGNANFCFSESLSFFVIY